MSALVALVARDMRLTLGRGSEGLVTLFFFLMVVMVFALALGGDAALIGRAAAGIIWTAAVLSALLTLESVYHRDYADGTLDLLLLSPLSAWQIVAAKMLSHWILGGLLLLPAALVAAPMLFVPFAALPVLLLSLLMGTLYLSLLGGLGAALTLGSRRPGLLLVVIVLPLYTPMLLLGGMAASAAMMAMPVKAYLLLQAALLLLALPLAPAAAAASLTTNMRSS
ncbi:MAG TPA: heme exporter protein CcmB [Alphaproteobacteria bacterium]|nr:heme exporter protein CcmB [Rhodospirillaceae bacterium]HRJ67875.1 heme exporter protein CcmB [Alphaproteobacteria bacterium]